MDRVETLPAKAIEVRGLTRSFNNRPALRGIDLEVARGESIVILGPNGAGKTTLIKVLATIMRPTSGEMIIDGLDYRRDAEAIRRRIGVVTHDTFFYSNLTARENLEFYGRLYDIADPRGRAREAAELVGMTTRLDERVGALSRGMQQRLSLARALLHRPAIMLLDEPETGLDQEATALFWNVVRGEGAGKRTVVLTTHHPERGLTLADRVVILDRGAVVYRQSSRSLDINSLKQAYEASTRGKA
jgi:heme ABC exporter ATP-binding subunit CcmA